MKHPCHPPAMGLTGGVSSSPHHGKSDQALGTLQAGPQGSPCPVTPAGHVSQPPALPGPPLPPSLCLIPLSIADWEPSCSYYIKCN